MELAKEWWNNPVAHDVYSCFRSMESKLPQFRDYPLKPDIRKNFVDTLAMWCDRFQLNTPAKHLAILLLDTVFDSYDVAAENAHLVTAGCMLLAAKFEAREVEIPHLSEVLEHCLSNKFSSRECMQMELVLLEFFQWNICYPTAAHFSDYLRESSLVCRSRSKQYPLSAELLELFEKYINYFLEISLQDYNFRLYSPSLVSAACVAYARQCTHLKPTWPAHVQRMSGLKEKDFSPIMTMLQRLVNENKRFHSQYTLAQATRQYLAASTPVISYIFLSNCNVPSSLPVNWPNMALVSPMYSCCSGSKCRHSMPVGVQPSSEVFCPGISSPQISEVVMASDEPSI